jgi:uncharacterized protein YgfB (UPF0149 family)
MHLNSNDDNFSEFFGILSKSAYITHPAEIHGTIAAIICLNSKQTEKSWFNTLIKTLESRVGLAAQEKSEVMFHLYDKTHRQLLNAQDNFQLLLPGDEYSLNERAAALSSWCNGFVYALRFADASFDKDLTEEGILALGSIANIANLDFSQIQIQDTEDEFFFKVIRHIQSSVELLYHELGNNVFQFEYKESHNKHLH